MPLPAVHCKQMSASVTVKRESLSPAKKNSKGEYFSLPLQKGTMDLWLRGRRPRPLFFDEWLTACFERRLDMELCQLGEATLDWIFTGPEGKVRITLSSDRLSLQQSFHESFYLNSPTLLFDQDFDVPRDQWFQAEMSEFDGETGINIHPECRWHEKSHILSGPVESVTVILSHNMELAVWINGKKVIAQNCLQDLQRHQLHLSDLSGSCAGFLCRPEAAEVSVCISPDQPKQTMIGFGGTTIPTAYAELSDEGREKFWKIVVTNNLLIQRENPIAGELNEAMDNWDHLPSAIPHYYGDSFPNGNISDFSLNREYLDRGGEVWFEFWHFPGWMIREDETYLDEKGKERSGPLCVEAYARAIVKYCQRSCEATGQPPTVVGVQNENSHPKKTYHAMVAALRRALDEAGFQCVQIHMSDANMLSSGSNWGRIYADAITRAKTFTQHPETWEMIDYAAAHMYDYQEYLHDPDAFDAPMRELRGLYGDRPFLSTELCVNSPRYQMRSYRLALLMGELIHKNLTILDAASVLYCWTLLNVEQPSYAWTRSLLAIDRSNGFLPIPSSNQFRVYTSWSRHIRKGMRRLELSCDHSDLLCSAFAGWAGEKTWVALNRGNAPLRVSLEPWCPEDFLWEERTSPYMANQVSECRMSGIDSVEIAPGEILTLTNVPLHHAASVRKSVT